MSTPLDGERFIIPRWRPYKETVALGELDRTTSRQKAPLPIIARDIHLLDSKKAYLIANPVLSAASDLLSTAYALDDQEGVEFAKSIIIKLDSPEASFAKNNLTRISHNLRENLINSELNIGADKNLLISEISTLKKRAISDPRNYLVYVDLARSYAILGQNIPAEKAIIKALKLGRENRFVLRSAVRFYVHIGEPDKAYDLVKRAPNLRLDPWLLACEIAAAKIIDTTSKNIKYARENLSSDNISPFHLSELAASMGTIELSEGSSKKARKLFEKSLIDPTENVIAQVCSYKEIYFSDQSKFQSEISKIPRAFEANASILMQMSEWERAFSETERWFFDQPFSSRPAVFGSYLASTVLGKPDSAIKLIDMALISNMNDAVLLNNKAFALIQMKEYERADQLIQAAFNLDLEPAEKTALMATSAMLDFRRGSLVKGATKYKGAIEMAKATGDLSLIALAELHYEVESELAGIPNTNAEQLITKAIVSDDKSILAAAIGLKKWLQDKADISCINSVIEDPCGQSIEIDILPPTQNKQQITLD